MALQVRGNISESRANQEAQYSGFPLVLDDMKFTPEVIENRIINHYDSTGVSNSKTSYSINCGFLCASNSLPPASERLVIT